VNDFESGLIRRSRAAKMRLCSSDTNLDTVLAEVRIGQAELAAAIVLLKHRHCFICSGRSFNQAQRQGAAVASTCRPAAKADEFVVTSSAREVRSGRSGCEGF
jgi:hypothetical protein